MFLHRFKLFENETFLKPFGKNQEFVPQVLKQVVNLVSFRGSVEFPLLFTAEQTSANWGPDLRFILEVIFRFEISKLSRSLIMITLKSIVKILNLYIILLFTHLYYSSFQYNQFLTIYQGVHITYFKSCSHKSRFLD